MSRAWPPSLDVEESVALGREVFTFSAYGVRIGIRCVNLDLWNQLPDYLPPGAHSIQPSALDRVYTLVGASAQSGQPRTETVSLYVNDDLIAQVPTVAQGLDVLESALQLYIAESARPYAFVHAGVVGWRGHAIVLPGSSYAGKSTLVAALVAAGATYYSDEYAVCDSSGAVYPYPRRLSLRAGANGSSQRLDLCHWSPDDDPLAHPLSVKLVALLTYRAEAGWQTERLTPGAALLACCRHTVPIRQRPAEAFSILRGMLTSAVTIAGTRGEASEAVDWLLRAVEGSDRQPSPMAKLGPAGGDGAAGATGTYSFTIQGKGRAL